MIDLVIRTVDETEQRSAIVLSPYYRYSDIESDKGKLKVAFD